MLVDGQPAATTKPAQVQRVDPLFTELKSRYVDGGRAHTTYSLAVSDGVDAAVLKSVFQTAAFAGWPEARFGAGAAVLLKARIPGPPGNLASRDLEWPSETLILVVRSDVVEVSRVVTDLPQASRSVPRSIGVVEKSKVDADLVALLSRECSAAKPCTPAVLYAAATADSSLVRHALEALGRSISSSRERPAEVQFRINEPEARGTPIAIRASTPAATANAPVTTVSGRLPPEHIQQVIRAQFSLFRECYEAGLKRNASLAGRVSVRFVIGRDGAVSNVTDAGSELPDQEVVQCMLKAFHRMRFDRPDAGIVTVIYPIQLEPG